MYITITVLFYNFTSDSEIADKYMYNVLMHNSNFDYIYDTTIAL